MKTIPKSVLAPVFGTALFSSAAVQAQDNTPPEAENKPADTITQPAGLEYYSDYGKHTFELGNLFSLKSIRSATNDYLKEYTAGIILNAVKIAESHTGKLMSLDLIKQCVEGDTTPFTANNLSADQRTALAQFVLERLQETANSCSEEVLGEGNSCAAFNGQARNAARAQEILQGHDGNVLLKANLSGLDKIIDDLEFNDKFPKDKLGEGLIPILNSGETYSENGRNGLFSILNKDEFAHALGNFNVELEDGILSFRQESFDAPYEGSEFLSMSEALSAATLEMYKSNWKQAFYAVTSQYCSDSWKENSIPINISFKLDPASKNSPASLTVVEP